MIWFLLPGHFRTSLSDLVLAGLTQSGSFGIETKALTARI